MTGVEWEARAAALAERLAKAGDLRAEVKVSAGAGNLALLQRFEDRLEGRFDARWAAFMAMRHGGDADRCAQSEPGKITQNRIDFRTVGLVGDEDSLDISAAEHGGDLFVGRR